MGILDRLFGRPSRREASYGSPSGGGTPAWGTPPSSSSAPPAPSTPSYPPEPGADDRARRDEEAVRRYRYLLRTAPPDAIEQAHAEAFAQLTPDQRRQVLGQLANNVPEYERVRDDDPRTLARMATRAEMRQPGFLERVFGGYGPGYGRGGYGPGYGPGYGYGGGGFGMGGMGMGGIGMGGLIAGGLLSSIAGSFIGTAIAEEMFDHNDYMSSGFADPDGGSNIDFDNNQVDASGVDDRTAGDFDNSGDYSASGDYGSGDYGSGDGGDYGTGGDGGGGDGFGDFGDGGGDFGDFGGGDFGGGNDW
jgi:hypothetical protein